MPKDESAWKLRASTPFIYESEENVVQKFINGGRSKVSKTVSKPKSITTCKKVDNKSSLKSQTFAPAVQKKTQSPQMSPFKSKTCNFDAEMAASPVAISHKYYEYITDANAKFNVNGMGVFRKFKPDVPTITCKPQVFDWNLNLQQNILHKPKDSSADLRYNGGKSKARAQPPPPTPTAHASRNEQKKSKKLSYGGNLDDNLSPSTLALIRRIIRDRSRTNMKAKKWGTMSTDSDSTLEGVYINIPSSSRQKPKNMKRVPHPDTDTSRDSKVSKNSSAKKDFCIKKAPNVAVKLKKKSSPMKNSTGPQPIASKPKAKKTSVAKKRSPKDAKKEKDVKKQSVVKKEKTVKNE